MPAIMPWRLLNVHSSPRRRIIVRWYMSDAPALALSVDISDRVTVMERDAGIDYFLETIRFRLQRGQCPLGPIHVITSLAVMATRRSLGRRSLGTHRFGY